LQLKAMELQSKHAIGSQPDAVERPRTTAWSGRSWKSPAIRPKPPAWRSATTPSRQRRSSQLDQMTAQHDAAMDMAAHQQRDDQFAQR
jgi:hypothetical protein